jgi:crotonobetaine/carnitine-CoA ligase
MKAARLATVLRHAQCRAAIVSDDVLATLDEARASAPALDWVAVIDTGEAASQGVAPAAHHRRYEALVASGPQAAALPLEAPLHPMQLIYTSGTTGDPKGIQMTHERYISTSSSVAAAFDYREGDRLYSALSLTHANAQLITLGAGLCRGIEVVFSRRFSKTALWDVLRRHRCTTFTLLGGMTSALYAQPPSPRDRDHAVRFVVCAGMPPTLWRAFEQRFGLRVLEFWGTAEGGITVNPVDVGPVGSIGQPVPALQCRVVDEEDRPVPVGQPGELQVRHADGRPFVVEYFREPEASHRKCAGGWLRSGDVVHQDDQGWLYFHHRQGTAIRRNGEFVSPAVLERAIAETGLVADVYVYGVPRPGHAPGEKAVVAAVVPASADFEPAGLLQALRATLESSQLPDGVQVLSEIPKTASEKPQDRFLIEQLASTTWR